MVDSATPLSRDVGHLFNQAGSAFTVGWRGIRTWNRRQYFRLEMRLASHSLNRFHREIGRPGTTPTVHLTVGNMEAH
jgi:hypothetical protein